MKNKISNLILIALSSNDKASDKANDRARYKERKLKKEKTSSLKRR